jgi:AraC family transcriptional regulator
MTNLSIQPFRARVQVSLEHREPGLVELRRRLDHLLRVHASPVTGACAKSRFRYAPGEIDILPAELSDQWEEWTASKTLMVTLPDAVLREAAAQAGIGVANIGLDARWQLQDPQIAHIAWALNAEREAGNPNGGLYTEFLGMALGVHLSGQYRATVRPRGGLARHELRNVAEYIETHLDQELPLSRLAALAGMSVSHFGAQFKKSTGLAVHEYVIQRRVERAKRLLQESPLPVSQIALDVGFSHQSHLARWMRRLLGVTPGDIRRSREGIALQ